MGDGSCGLKVPVKINDKCKFLLNVIDIFSRYAWSVPLKDNTGK